MMIHDTYIYIQSLPLSSFEAAISASWCKKHLLLGLKPWTFFPRRIWPPPQRSAAAAAAAGNSAAMLTARELRLIAETFAIGGCYILISASFLGTKKIT